MNRITKFIPHTPFISKGNFFYFCILLFVIILLGYVIPPILSPHPWGTDVFYHMLNTVRMFESNSLVEYYETSFNLEYLRHDYPFGMWYFGSILMKITGITIHQIVILLPFALLLILILVYFVYASKLLSDNSWAILALIFLISMPFLAVTHLNYSTNRFIAVFLVMILIIAIDEKKKFQNAFLVIAILFALVITHTGTYMFVIFFSTAYFLLFAAIWKKIDWWMFFITAMSIFLYVVAVQEFQFVQPQYMDKGRMVLDISDKIASVSGIELIRDMGSIFYDNIFVSNNMSYVIFWSAMIFCAGMLIILIRNKVEGRLPFNGLTLPFIGNVTNISHSFLTTPFWIGPVQTILSIFGIFTLDSKGKCIFIAILISAVFPASLQPAEGTGALREIYYLFLIIPITAAAGMMVVYPKIQKFADTPRKQIIGMIILCLIFIPLIVAPVIGSIHYVPQISGLENDRENLIWLSAVGEPYEGVSGWAHRQEIDVYTKKNSPNTQRGTETKSYYDNLRQMYFSSGSENAVQNLYSLNIQYFITSKVMLDAYEAEPGALRIDSNTLLDKVFSSDDNFGIYDYIEQEPQTDDEEIPVQVDNIKFNGQTGIIRDVGSSYLAENDYYKVRLNKQMPDISYLGTRTENMLGEGFLTDTIVFYSKNKGDFSQFSTPFAEQNFDSVVKSGNSIQYRGVVKIPESDENLATLQVTYTFYEKSIRRDIQVANDMRENKSSDLGIIFYSVIFVPASDFTFTDLSEGEIKEVSRRIYPSQGSIPLKDLSVNRLYINEGNKGMLIKYADSAPYPNRILYGGSEFYDYGNIYVESRYSPAPGEVYHISQYFSVGFPEELDRNIDEYESVSLYDYPNGIIPFVLLDPDSTNSGNWETAVNYSIPFSSVDLYSVSSFNGTKDYSTQYDEIFNLRSGKSIMGILIPNLQYNLDTIRAVSEQGMPGIVGIPVNHPQSGVFEEGVHDLKEAYYHGEPSGVILVAVSLPQSASLGRGIPDEDIFSAWTTTLDAVGDTGGIAVFIWSIQDFSTQELLDRLQTVLSTAEKNGMTITSLDPLLTHKLLLKNVVVSVEKGIDSVNLEVLNNNKVDVRGVTIKVVLPEIQGGCPYTCSQNGRIVRIEKQQSRCVIYITCDVRAGESTRIIVEPSFPRERFGIDFSKLYHGMNTLVVRDDDGKPVGDALVRIDMRTYQSNEAGEVKFYVRRGGHNISIEKPGFRSRQVNITIQSKLSRYIDIIIPSAQENNLATVTPLFYPLQLKFSNDGL